MLLLCKIPTFLQNASAFCTRADGKCPMGGGNLLTSELI